MIEKLEIKRFKGLKNVKYENFGLINSIYGRNETGKSSVLDCICWLLCDSTLLYGSTSNNDELIDLNNPNELIEASLVINGNKIQRTYGHKLNDDETITDVNYYYINDRRCKSQKEYFEFVDNFLGLKFKTKEKINLKYALMNPFVLGKEIKQEVFRRLIKEILDVDFDEILFSKKEEYVKIKNDYKYQGCDINNLLTYYKQQIKNQSKIVESYNAKINSEFNEYNLEQLKVEHGELLSKKAETSLSFKSYAPSQEIANKMAKIIDLNNDLKKSKEEDYINSKPKVDENLEKGILILKESINKDIVEYNSLVSESTKLKNDVNTNNILVNKNKEQIELLESTKVEGIVCPNCNTKIITPEQEQVLKRVEERVQSLKQEQEEMVKIIETCNKKIDDLEPRLKELKQLILIGKDTLSKNNEELNKQKNGSFEIVYSENTKKLEKELETLNIELNELKEKDVQLYQEKLNNRNNEIAVLNEEISKKQSLINQVIANENLKIEKKNVLVEKSKFEMLLTVAKDYANDLALVIKEYCVKIFGNDIDFVMVKKNKSNDEQKPVCYAQIKGIPYNSLNSANNLLAGVIVIEKIKNYINANDIPVLFDIVDNVGQKTLDEIFSKVSSQIFYTEVDRTDKSERTLIVVKENTNK